METQCIQEQMVLQQLGRREVIGRFDGGRISSDAGGMRLREVERSFGILKRFAGCFRDYRDVQRTEHSLKTLISQRVYGIALGYEDLNDHDSLRHDVVMGVLCEKSDPSGVERVKDARTLYEDFYCAREDMENRIKEQQLGLFADRTSTTWIRSKSAKTLLFIVRLHHDADVAAMGTSGNRVGSSSMRYDSAQVVQDRCPD